MTIQSPNAYKSTLSQTTIERAHVRLHGMTPVCIELVFHHTKAFHCIRYQQKFKYRRSISQVGWKLLKSEVLKFIIFRFNLALPFKILHFIFRQCLLVRIKLVCSWAKLNHMLSFLFPQLDGGNVGLFLAEKLSHMCCKQEKICIKTFLLRQDILRVELMFMRNWNNSKTASFRNLSWNSMQTKPYICGWLVQWQRGDFVCCINLPYCLY